MNTTTARTYDNANSGVVFINDSDPQGVLTRGRWEDAEHVLHGLALGADVGGQRPIAVLGPNGGLLTTGHVTSTGASTTKAPVYRGKLGELNIVLWRKAGFFQVRVDEGAPEPKLSSKAAAFLGMKVSAPAPTPPADQRKAPPLTPAQQRRAAVAALDPNAEGGEGPSASSVQQSAGVPEPTGDEFGEFDDAPF